MSPKYDSLRKADPREVLKSLKKHQHEPSLITDWSLKEIGAEFGISAARVYQIKKGKRK
jgi:DNA-directed RNA polymerase specialized sigma subunit